MSHLVRLFVNRYKVYNLDNLIYAGNLEKLKHIETEEKYKFRKADVVNAAKINELLIYWIQPTVSFEKNLNE